MKNVFLYIGILLSGFAALAQNENNHWQLGQTDLNFSTNPNTVNTVSTIPAGNYGLASISDASGNLLFYTDGKTVWNKNHAVMQNGSNISYEPNSLQQVVIVPHPGDSNKYYIFVETSLATGSFGPANGHYVYSIVNFANNSLGELVQVNTFNNSPETMYSKLLPNMLNNRLNYSPLTVSKSSSGDSYWVIMQSFNSLYSYKLDALGLNSTPVVSTFPVNQIYHEGQYYPDESVIGIRRSMFKIAETGTNIKLYGLESSLPGVDEDPTTNPYFFYSVNFNNATGQFSNYQNLAFYTPDGLGASTYLFEFSPDFQKVYGLQYKYNYPSSNLTGQIIVKDLANLSTPGRLLYEFASPTTRSSGFYWLQKDKYGNLLVSSTSAGANKNKYLHKIENPDSFTNSSVRLNILYLNDKSIGQLPQLIPHVTHFCEENIVLSATETNNSFEYQAGTSITSNNAYTINSGSNITFKAGESIYLKANTIIKGGSVFLAKISECPAGRAAVSRLANDEETGTEIQSVFTTANFFSISPNPATTAFTLKSTLDMKHITVTSFDGKVMFNRDVNDKTTSYTIDVNGYTQGIYTVTVLTQTGETQIQKLIKN